MITFEGKTSNDKLHRVLRVLRRRHAKASFFFPGRWLNYHEKRARRIHRRGHALGQQRIRQHLVHFSGRKRHSSFGGQGTENLAKDRIVPAPFLRMRGGVRDLRTLRIARSMGCRSVR